MQAATRSLLAILLAGACAAASCTSQRLDPRTDVWYPATVQVEQCTIEMKVPTGGFFSRWPPATFIPTGDNWEFIASSNYDDEQFRIWFRLARYEHAEPPFKTPAAFITHVAKKDFGRLPPRLEVVHVGPHAWAHRYTPQAQRDPLLVVDSSDDYYFPLTSDYALVVTASYSRKVATNAKLHASRRAIGREVVANVRISNCGHYANP